MSLPLIVTQQANSDIERNANWWAQRHSIDDAQRWKAAVHEQLREIQSLPASSPLAFENPRFPIEIRQRSVGLRGSGYRALFTIRKNDILVLTVQRGNQAPLSQEQLRTMLSS